jgi:ribosome-associated heat shock protein Hsp15
LTAIARQSAPHGAPGPERAKTRLDQWLWFARLVKSRSLAARLCTAGAVAISGATVTKPNQTVKIGDVVAVVQGGFQRTVRVLAFGVRRGPASEARALYEEIAGARLRNAVPDWVPLLDLDDAADRLSPGPGLT